MSDLYVIGAQAINYYSKCGITRTSNLTSFMSSDVPDVPYTHLLSAAQNPAGLVIMSTNSGGVVTTSDFINYVSYDYQGKQAQIQKITWNQQFVAVGYLRDDQNNEQAYVWTTGNAFDEYSWQARYAVFDAYSAFTNVCTSTSNNLIAVGHANQLQTSLFLVGTATSSWQLIQMPPNLQGGLWSVVSDGVRVWVGGTGWVATALLSNLNTWTRTDLGMHKVISSMSVCNGVVVAVAANSLFYSTNGFDYASEQLPGRTLTQTHVYDDKVIVGSHSLLTESDLFVFDPADLSLKSVKSGVHAYAFVTV